MSRQIKIGNLTLGGGAPIRVQSMTNTDTMDTQATVDQALRMVEAGCELVRITAPDVKAAENLGRIKEELLKQCGAKTVIIGEIGPVIGAHAGPGTIALFYLGKSREGVPANG